MTVPKEYLLLMLRWTKFSSLFTFLLHLTPGMCSANLWATRKLSLPDRELGMWQGAAPQPSYSCKREKSRDSEAGRRVKLFMLLLLLLLFYLPHSLLTDVHFGNVFGDCFFTLLLFLSLLQFLILQSLSCFHLRCKFSRGACDQLLLGGWAGSQQHLSPINVLPKIHLLPRCKTSKFLLRFPDRWQLGQR